MTTPKLSRRTALGLGGSAILLPGIAWSQSTTRDVEGGIGGTGIVGVLTDFGDLLVSGNRLQTDRQTVFSDGFGTVAQSDLSIGDSLTVEGIRSPDAFVARRVHVTHPLVGRITARSADGRNLVVNGVDVMLERRSSKIGIGDRVAISGLWRGHGVVASRVSPAHTDQDLISGDVHKSFGKVSIGPTDLRGSRTAGLGEGSFLTALGTYSPERNRFQASDLIANRFTGAAGPLRQLSIEGYLEPTAAAPGYRIAGLGHSFARNLRLSEFADTRVLFNGPYAGKFAAERALVLPADPVARRAILDALSQSAG